MTLYADVSFDDPDLLELDDLDRELASNEDRKYLRAYASRAGSADYDYDYSRDDYPYGPNTDY